jgi:hypothetical protein
MLFYGGASPPGGSWTVHFDTYRNEPVWNEPGDDFVAVYRLVGMEPSLRGEARELLGRAKQKSLLGRVKATDSSLFERSERFFWVELPRGSSLVASHPMRIDWLLFFGRSPTPISSPNLASDLNLNLANACLYRSSLTLASLVFSDQNNVFDNRLCSRIQPTPAPVPFKNSPFQFRISILGPGLLGNGNTNNVQNPSVQSRLRVSFWNAGEEEPRIPLLECGVDLGEIFKQSSQGVEGRDVWVGVTSLTGESANRHLVSEASISCGFAGEWSEPRDSKTDPTCFALARLRQTKLFPRSEQRLPFRMPMQPQHHALWNLVSFHSHIFLLWPLHRRNHRDRCWRRRCFDSYRSRDLFLRSEEKGRR